MQIRPTFLISVCFDVCLRDFLCLFVLLLAIFFAIIFLFDVVVLVVALHAYCCCFPIIFAVFPRFPTFLSKIVQLLVVCCCFQFVGLFLIIFSLFCFFLLLLLVTFGPHVKFLLVLLSSACLPRNLFSCLRAVSLPCPPCLSACL